MNKKKNIWGTIMVLALIALILVLAYLAWYLFQDYMGIRHQQELQEQVTISQTEEETQEPEEQEEEEEPDPDSLGKEGESTEVPDSVFVDMENPIDFNALEEINPDLYAWIQLDNTNINYPIAQREGDDGFYLHHDMYGDAVFAGCLYTEGCNSKDWTDPMTIVYGHNMRNQTMFYDLHKFNDPQFFEDNRYFYIYTKDCIRVYEIYAAFFYDDRRTLEYFDLDDREQFQSYIDDLKNGTLDGYQGGTIRQETQVDADSRIVTLQTCVGSGGESRFLVQGVLVSEGGKVVNVENE
ncbi:MAG: class B sortase [Lachnospiraceae bacterium]|nr:class B sortase [Lachnospiraceae bacterium]